MILFTTKTLSKFALLPTTTAATTTTTAATSSSTTAIITGTARASQA